MATDPPKPRFASPGRMIEEQAVWTELQLPSGNAVDDLPYATHSGVWEFQGMKLNVHRLSNGMTIIEEGSMRQLLEWLMPADPKGE